MSNMMVNRLSGTQRVKVPAFSATRPIVQKATPALRRCSERPQSSRDVRMRAGQDDVGSSYANALIDLAEEMDVLEDIHNDVETMSALFKEDEDLKDLLTDPVISEEMKKDIVNQIAEKAKFSEYFVNFINLLIDQDRLVSGEAIFDSFEASYAEITDTQVATVYSAVKLEQEQQFLIAKKLQELTGSQNIKLKTVIDEDIIAGFSVDFGSAQIDMSIRGQIEDVAQELVAGGSKSGADLGGSNSSSDSNGSSVSEESLIGDSDIQKEVEEELSEAKEAALA